MMKDFQEKINQQIAGKVKGTGEKDSKKGDEEIVKQVSRNIYDRNSREKNIVIYGLKEPEGNLKEENMKQDANEMRGILNTTNHPDPDSVQFETVRLGGKHEQKKDGEEGKGGEQKKPTTRPLLVKFQNQADKEYLMSNLRRLKGGPKISIKDDMSREDRNKEKALREEADAKNGSNQDQGFFYAVRGEKWNRRVIRIKKKVQSQETEGEN